MSNLLAYDRSVFNKIHSLYDEVFFAAPEEVFKANAKSHRGKIMMPFIGLWRLPDFSVDKTTYNDSYVRKGPIRATRGSGVEYPNQKVAMHGLPVSLQYQVDIYAIQREVCDGLASELLLEMYENPWVDVTLPDMGDFVQQFNIDVDDNVTDNSSITEFDETNRFYRLTLTLNMPSAVIYRIGKMNKIEKAEIDFIIDEKKGDYLKLL